MIVKTTQAINNAFIIKVVNEKLAENPRLQLLQDYYMGKHKIVMRAYDDPTQPNNRIPVNYCRKIADFLTSYLVGQPIRYEAPQIILDNLNYNDEAETTQEIVRNMNIMGLGCELFYTDMDGIPRFANIDPQESIFIKDDTIEGNLTAYIRFYPNADEPDLYNVTVYTATDYTEYRMSRAVGELKIQGEPTPHLFGDVPAILYPNNTEMLGAFEGVMSLQDALNIIVSDEVNDFERFVDAFLVLKGMEATKPGDLGKMKQDRVFLLGSESDAQWLVKNVNNTHIKELKLSIIAKIHELGSIPDIENMGSFGTSGVALRFKMLGTDIAAAQQERTVHKGILRRLELLYSILRITDPSVGFFTDVNFTFERNPIIALEALDQKRIDLSLVERNILSKETFLRTWKGMTPEEAAEELRRVSVETDPMYGIGNNIPTGERTEENGS